MSPSRWSLAACWCRGSGGVFSFTSFAMRIVRTWPEAWEWILHQRGLSVRRRPWRHRRGAALLCGQFLQPFRQSVHLPLCEFRSDGYRLPGWTSSMGLGLPRENCVARRLRRLPCWPSIWPTGQHCRCSRIRYRRCSSGQRQGCCGNCARRRSPDAGVTPTAAHRRDRPVGISPIAAADSNDLAHAR